MSSSNPSDKSDRSDQSDQSDPLLPPHGGYRRLKTFQIAERVFDGTALFCDRFIERRSRTHDQMVQAARSGRQNIAEASIASGTSKKTELKLTNVAKASLEELLLDYEDFLRQRRLPRWDKNSAEALGVRCKYLSDKSDVSDVSDNLDPYGIATAPADIAANTLLCLINQATYLLKRQIERLERDFLEQGGITERLYRRRLESREASDSSDKSDKSDPSDKTLPPPACPQCGKPMCRRTARQGPHEGRPFWGCSGYPDCRGIVPISSDSSDRSDRSDLSDQSDRPDNPNQGPP